MPLSSSEHAQLQALLQKASEPVDAESTSSEGGFSLVTGSMCGAMTDGAKRRACSPVKEDSQGSEKLSYAGYGVTAHVHTRELMPGHTPDLEVPYVPKSRQSPHGKITLPPSVLSVEQWGRTLITWGQYNIRVVACHIRISLGIKMRKLLDIRSGAWPASILLRAAFWI